MPEFTDLQCSSPEIATAVQEYLRTQIADDEELGRIDSVVRKSTLCITYLDLDRNHPERRAIDMQLKGYRDGVAQHLEQRQPCTEVQR